MMPSSSYFPFGPFFIIIERKAEENRTRIHLSSSSRCGCGCVCPQRACIKRHQTNVKRLALPIHFNSEITHFNLYFTVRLVHSPIFSLDFLSFSSRLLINFRKTKRRMQSIKQMFPPSSSSARSPPPTVFFSSAAAPSPACACFFSHFPFARFLCD